MVLFSPTPAPHYQRSVYISSFYPVNNAWQSRKNHKAHQKAKNTVWRNKLVLLEAQEPNAAGMLELSDQEFKTGFPGGSDNKESTCNSGDLGLIPGLGRSPGGRHGNSLQYSCLENPHGQRSLASYSPWSHKESDTTEWLSTWLAC